MAKKYVFIVGNSNYLNQEQFPTIPYCKNDAEEIFKTLCEKEYSLFEMNGSVIKIDIAYQEFLEELNLFFSSIESTDLVLFYFAGHGRVLGGKSFHLVMNDSLTNSKMLVNSTFNIESLIPYFTEKKVNKYIIILDSCRAGKALSTPGLKNRGESLNIECSDFLPENISGEGKIIIASSQHYQYAKESGDLKHGIFSYYFIKGINDGACVNTIKPYISIKDIYNYTFENVVEKHADTFQKPIFSGQSILGELYIAKNLKYDEKLTQKRTSNKLKHCIVHPLPPAPVFIGREKEINKLLKFWNDNFIGVISLLGIGGAGKTAIASQFLREIINDFHNNGNSTNRIFVWSFYIDQNINNLFEKAYSYYNNGKEIDSYGSNALYKLIDLLDEIDERNLIILDGLERVQKPINDSKGCYGDVEDFLLKNLIKKLADRVGKSLCVITSRFPVTDLDDWRNYSYRDIKINDLSNKDAYELMKYNKLKFSVEDFNSFVNEYGTHALLVDHASKFTYEYFNGNLKNLTSLEEPKSDSQNKKERKLAKIFQAYEKYLTDIELDILSRVCLFRFGTTPDTLNKVFKDGSHKISGELKNLSKIDLKRNLNRLVGLHLVLNETENHYTTHPAVKDHFYNLFKDIDKVHGQVSNYFNTLTNQPGVEFPTNTEVLDLLEEMIYHLLSSNAVDEAKDIYISKLGGYQHLAYNLGDYTRGLRIINLFDKPFWEDKAIYLNNLGNIPEAIKWIEHPSILAPGYPHGTIRFPLYFLRGKLTFLLEIVIKKLSLSTVHHVRLLQGDHNRIKRSAFYNSLSDVNNIYPLLAYHFGSLTKPIITDTRKISVGEGKKAIIFNNNEQVNRKALAAVEVLRTLKQFVQAKNKLDSTLDWIMKSGSQELLCSYYLTKSRLIADTNENAIGYKDAFKLVYKSIKISQNCKFGLYFIEGCILLAKLFWNTKEYSKALCVVECSVKGNKSTKEKLIEFDLGDLVKSEMFGSDSPECNYKLIHKDVARFEEMNSKDMYNSHIKISSYNLS